MKCPKCGYLGFEEVPRCRNCGYDFDVARTVATPELTLRGPLGESGELPDLELSRSPAGELPLFVTDDAGVDPFPASARVPPPRPPLAVRRATPEIPRGRTDTPRSPMPMLDLADPDAERTQGLDTVLRTPVRPPAPETPVRALHHPILLEEVEAAAMASRAAAALIDLSILALIDAIVIYFTLRICGLTIVDVSLLPKAPLLAFLMLENGAYFAAFTAGGQTLGKMSVGIRVVSVDGPPLDLGRSLTRTLVWALLAIPAGLGFLTAFFDPDRRGLHDRLTGTRVVRAGAA